MKKRSVIFRRTAAIALAIVMIAVLVPTFGTSASAVTSLTHIEEIKSSMTNGTGTLRILEIVPTPGSGTIGYYVAGQEPTKDWLSEAAGKSLNERKAYVTGLFNNLVSLGLMTSDAKDTTPRPLTKLADYNEYYPWNTAPTDAVTLTLKNPESQDVTGKFTEAADGDYILNSTPKYVGTNSGSYVQNIKNFTYTTTAVEGAYYYNPTFTGPIDFTNADINETLEALATVSGGTAMYTAVYKDGNPAPKGAPKSEIGHYVYAGTLGVNNFMLDTSTDYYYVNTISDDSQTDSDLLTAEYAASDNVNNVNTSGCYYGVLNEISGYKSVGEGKGCFNMTSTDYRYVGEGNGNYSFASQGSEKHNVTYDTIKVVGGYKNNNWFLKYVLDVDDAKIADYDGKVQVYCVTPDTRDAALMNNLSSLIDDAGLVLVSGGLKVSSTGKTVSGAALGSYTGTCDLTEALSNKLQEAITNKKAVLTDGNIASSTFASNVKTFAEKYEEMNTAAADTGFVKGGVYYFKPTADLTSTATVNFNKPFATSLYSTSSSPFNEVYNEIDYENFLRQKAGQKESEWLSYNTTAEKIDLSMASCVRYIINYSGQRVVNGKDKIRVLDVEPATQYSSGSQKLTVATVKTWLPEDSKVLKNTASDSIVIDTMSSAEFISKIDDINEKYDLVYIGASTDNLPSRLNYTDNNMDGLYYSNIGDIRDSAQYNGMMDSDYYTYNGSTHTTTDYTTYRLSGNDITETKKTELENFAASGLPVVISDKLVNAKADESTLSVVSISSQPVGSDSATLTATATLTPGRSGQLRFTWYNGNSNIGTSAINISASNNTYTATSGKFYPQSKKNCRCTVEFKPDSGSEYSNAAVSQTINFTQKNGFYSEQTGKSNNNVLVIPVDCSYDYSSYSYSYNYYYTASKLLAEYTYKWQYYDDSNGQWIDYSGSDVANTETTTTLKTDDYSKMYRCVASNGNNTYYSPICCEDNYYSQNFIINYPSWATLSATITANDTTLTVIPSLDPAMHNLQYSYQWYYGQYDRWGKRQYGRINGEKASTIETKYYNYTYYYCVVNVNGQDAPAYTETVKYGSTWVGTVSGTKTDVTIPAASAGINTNAVDNCSVLYDTMSDILTKPNVMADSSISADAQKQTLQKYLNLSKPSIDITSKPTEYDGSGDITVGSSAISQSLSTGNSRTLTYKFTISNPTDPNPVSTRYTCQLFVDLNADGRYRDNEQISDLLITYSEDGVTQTAEENALRAGVEYTVSRNMPSNRSGIISWCIKITQDESDGTINANSSIHASQSGYTYIKPDGAATVIKVLQITAVSSDKTTLSLDNTTTSLSNRSPAENKYLNIFQYLKDKGVYDIQVETITISQANAMGVDVLKAKLNNKDMLILGYANVYGMFESDYKYGLTADVAEKVTNYIKSGKAVLFTHDTTSLHNEYIQHPSGQYWGYFFNTVVRDAVGLDRYGVTSPTFGLTNYIPSTLSSLRDGSIYNDFVSSGYSSIGKGTSTSDNKIKTAVDALEKSGYSVAYKPKSRTVDAKGNIYKELVPQTQGAINVRLEQSSGFNSTNSVSQVNKGQITTFPFNINTKSFCNITDAKYNTATDYLHIGTTHEQYYQLNMNSNDIAVWFCLADGVYNSEYKNDGVNAYYIYNRGNITYSGAGHDPQNVTTEEAELFVNTMIAAYRSAATAPTMEFESTDAKAITSQLLPVDINNSGTSQTVTAAENTRVYFKINDANLVASKIINAKFYYDKETKNGNTTTTPKTQLTGMNIYTAAGDKLVCSIDDLNESGSTLTLRSDTLYYFTIPDGVLGDLAGSSSATGKIYGDVTTTIGGAAYPGNEITLSLQKLGYRFLR